MGLKISGSSFSRTVKIVVGIEQLLLVVSQLFHSDADQKIRFETFLHVFLFNQQGVRLVF